MANAVGDQIPVERNEKNLAEANARACESHQCVADLSGGNRLSNKGKQMKRRRRSGLMKGERGNGPPELSVAGRNATTETAAPCKFPFRVVEPAHFCPATQLSHNTGLPRSIY
ncbi:hypothetical protein EVAR_45781_1 [Eumeta japonica]|uniref:Uncharacterized protein n=1 Tax=Eumeta variegata TaxID=151549 RepID=A0A4C1WZS5_EUMVA|nr:hypothetical protein EVAR_45781_1 [Eumeta japonica]